MVGRDVTDDLLAYRWGAICWINIVGGTFGVTFAAILLLHHRWGFPTVLGVFMIPLILGLALPKEGLVLVSRFLSLEDGHGTTGLSVHKALHNRGQPCSHLHKSKGRRFPISAAFHDDTLVGKGTKVIRSNLL